MTLMLTGLFRHVLGSFKFLQLLSMITFTKEAITLKTFSECTLDKDLCFIYLNLFINSYGCLASISF